MADAGSLTSNSALTGLKTIDGSLYLYNGATVTTSGALSNSGSISLDNDGANGGSSLTVAGALTNDGYIQIGPDNNSLSSATTVSATSIFNFVGTTYGTIDIFGNDSACLPAPIPAALDLSGKAGFGKAGTVEGNVNVAYDGQIVFGSNGQDHHYRRQQRADPGRQGRGRGRRLEHGSNSALTGLKHRRPAISTSTTVRRSRRPERFRAAGRSVSTRTGGGNGGSSLTVGGA